MKSLFKKIKRNKLRSTLIGISAFLFGFISISIFNNIGDTYALDNGTSKSCYYCYSYKLEENIFYWGNSKEEMKELMMTEEMDEKYDCDFDIKHASKLDSEEVCNRENAYYSCYKCMIWNPSNYWSEENPDRTACEYMPNTTYSECMYYRTDYDVYLDPNGGVWKTNDEYNGTSEEITKYHLSGRTYFKDIGADSAHVIRDGYFLNGWLVGSPNSDKVYYSYIDPEDIFTHFYANWIPKSSSPSDYNDVPMNSGDATTGGNTSGGEQVTAYTRDVYKITYNLNGGSYIDGTTESRVTYIPSDKVIGEFKTNPIKEGYKFKEWQLNGKKFDFNQKPTADMTLTAVYEELTNDDKMYYCENATDVLDYSTKLCYDVLKADNKNTYNYSLYKYDSKATFCYAASSTNAGAVQFRVDDQDFTMSEHLNISGKAIDDSSKYSEYKEEETWVSNDTCQIATECSETVQSNDIYTNGCEIKWSTITYSTNSATTKKEVDGDEPDTPTEDEKQEPDDSSEGSKPSDDKTDQELSDNSGTGDALIIIAWLVGLAGLGYTAYYFTRKNKEN